MLLLRYQRQRAQDAEEGGVHRIGVSEHDMRRKINDRDLKSDSHRAATRGTLICIFVCGSLLLSLGLTLLLAGLLVPKLKKDPTPWLVTGPTCIVLGILVLLLSVEIILKLRKISTSDEPSDKNDSRESSTKPSWGSAHESSLERKAGDEIITRIPVIVQAATPLRQLDATALPQTMPEAH